MILESSMPGPHDELLVGGTRFARQEPGLALALSQALAARQRPRCLCRSPGVEMYIARLGQSYQVKRMPGTGSLHDPACASYEPPAELSGLGPLLGTAIVEDPSTGLTRLKLDFAMSRRSGANSAQVSGTSPGSGVAAGSRLSLRGLLHYLWDQAGLTRWQAGFAGRRNWAVVRRHLLQAAEHKTIGSAALLSRLYIPEPFHNDQRAALDARREARWLQIQNGAVHAHPLMLMIAELKELSPARHGYRALLKHLPDTPMLLDEALYQRMTLRFSTELALWGMSDELHVVMMATMALTTAGVPTIFELTLMLVSGEWLPLDDRHDQVLVSQLVRSDRSFIKCLRYNLAAHAGLARAALLDAAAEPVPLRIAVTDAQAVEEHVEPTDTPTWVWRALCAPMPALPNRSLSGRAVTP